MLVDLALPPGLFRVGTEYQSARRFYDANLWRWSDGFSGPVGGWEQLGSSTATGTPRGMHGWVDLSGVSWAAIGTEQEVYSLETDGTLTAITPSGWSDVSTEAAWTFDNAGQQLFGVNDADGTIYTWVPGDVAAAALTNAPIGSSLIVTDERILMVFGADGDPRAIAWCDVEGFTSWTPTTTNAAGDYPIQSGGELQGAVKIRGGILIGTTEDVHLARYLGRPLIYGFDRQGGECGWISRDCCVSLDDFAIWMGPDDFYIWNGGVSSIPCEIKEDVFGSAYAPTRGINRAKKHLVRVVHVAEHNEIWWMYPKGSATECSHVAVYNYRENHWSLHTLVRLCGVPRGNGFGYALMMGSDGKVWQHEKGSTRTGAGTIYAKSGPLELGKGDRIMLGRYVYPDEGSSGDVSTYFHARMYPNGSAQTFGPFTSANPSGCKFTGRQVAVEHRLVSGEGKVGTFRVDVVLGGMM